MAHRCPYSDVKASIVSACLPYRPNQTGVSPTNETGAYSAPNCSAPESKLTLVSLAIDLKSIARFESRGHPQRLLRHDTQKPLP